jgi:hypothetical protein
MRCLPIGELASVVDTAVGVEADLGRGGDVQHAVHPPVPRPGQAMSHGLAGGGFDRRRAGPGGEPVAVSEPGDVADLGGNPGGHDDTDSRELGQGDLTVVVQATGTTRRRQGCVRVLRQRCQV